jgi:hypothetical protein
MPRKIFWPMREELTGGWRKLHNEEFRNLYTSSNITLVIISRRIRSLRHVIGDVMCRGEVFARFWLGNVKEGYHLEYVGADWRIILKLVLNR